MLIIVLAGLVLLNLWTFLAFGRDKSRAVAGLRRIPEHELLGLALIGGTPGALLGRNYYRHKTRKQPFSFNLQLIATVQAGTLIGWLLI
jgi:uncharacterized membrane protein YsdA (DUF1294 family)